MGGVISVIRDVSRRKKGEEIRRRNRQRLKLIVEHLPAILWTTDPNLNITSLMGQLHEREKLQHETTWYINRSVAEILRTDGYDETVLSAHRNTLEEASGTFEVEFSEKVFEAHTEPMYENGNVAGVLGLALDVTERRRLLRQKEQRVRELRCISELSRLSLEAGSDLDTLLRNFARLVPDAFERPDSVHVYLSVHGSEYYSEGFRETSVQYSLPVECAHGEKGVLRVFKEEASVESHDTAFSDETEEVLRILADRLTGIARRIRAEEEARRAGRQLTALFDSALDSIVLLDDEARLVKVNQATARHTGYTEDELLAMNARDLIPPETMAQFDEAWSTLLSEGSLSREREFLFKDGSRGTWGYNAVANILPGLHLFMSRDVTARARYEEELAQSLKEKDILLKEIHHRVKNNLQLIQSILSLQADRAESGAARHLATARRRVQTLADVYNLLLHDDSIATIDIGRYIHQIVERLTKTSELELRINMDVESFEVTIDTAVPCGLIVNELVTNSLEHAFSSRQSGTIWVSLAKSSGTISLEIRDDGVGMEEERIHTPDSLGLMVVHSLVSQLNGTLTASNKGGAQIRVEFPAE